MIKMPSAEEAESPEMKLNEKNTTPRYHRQQPCLVESDELKLSVMGSIPGTAVRPRQGALESSEK